MSKSLSELSSASALKSFISSHASSACIVTFSATWCGPCKAARPALEELAKRPDAIPMAIVHEHDLSGELALYNIRAFPTHVLFIKGREQERVEGANIAGVQAMMQRAPPVDAMPASGGATLGGGDTKTLTPQQARLQRLAALGVKEEEEKKPVAASKPDVVMQDTEAKQPEPMETDDAEPTTPTTTDPAAGCEPQALKTLTEEMGFSVLRAQKGLLYSQQNTVEGAIEWLTAHQDDADIDEPITNAGLKVMSYKCNTCGKLLSNAANLELHANKTGHTDFEESTENAPVLTAEEKTAKIAEIKELLKKKRAEREAAEQVDEVEREKQRRLMGANMQMTKEQHEAEQRKRDAYLRQKEKQSYAKERARIKAELEKDKLERMANKGKLKSKLGVEGYHPDAIQYDVDPMTAASGTAAAAGASPEHKKAKVDPGKIDEYITKVSSYRAGGDGGKCLKVLLAYVGNVVDQPDEAKFRSINMDNKVFKTKVKPFVGAKLLLLAVGFHQAEKSQDALVLSDDADKTLLADTKAKLQAALERYG